MAKNLVAARTPRRKRRRPADASIKPKGQWHHGDLRSSLIAWSTHILDTEGTGAMSMRAAAKLAGVSQGAPAHHFVDRNGLLAAIAAQGFRDMVSLRLQRLEATDPSDRRARLRAVMLGYVEFAMKYPARFHLMFGPDIERREAYPELAAASQESVRLLTSVMMPFLEDKDTTLSESTLAFAVWAATHGLATLAVNHRRGIPLCVDRSTGQMSEIVVQFCLAALESNAFKNISIE
jgi:AcrR family transcriptional regulator